MSVQGHRVGIHHTCRAVQNRDTRALQQVLIDAAQAGYFLVLGGNQVWPGERRRRHRPAEARRVGKILGEVGRLHQQFFGNAAANDTGTAITKVLGNRHACTEPGRYAGGAHTARSTTDDEELIVV